jgi:hypothetical protein
MYIRIYRECGWAVLLEHLRVLQVQSKLQDPEQCYTSACGKGQRLRIAETEAEECNTEEWRGDEYRGRGDVDEFRPTNPDTAAT